MRFSKAKLHTGQYVKDRDKKTVCDARKPRSLDMTLSIRLRNSIFVAPIRDGFP
jgi:hypothetical protein